MLAVDLETDGESIWEIGCSGAGLTKRVHDAALEADFDTALGELGQPLQDTTLVVGHDILAWDWPILAARLPEQTAPLIWDTMLLQFLLDPLARLPNQALCRWSSWPSLAPERRSVRADINGNRLGGFTVRRDLCCYTNFLTRPSALLL